MKIEKIGSHKFVGLNLSNYESESISWKEYDNIKKVGNTDDVKSSTITNITPTEIQVLDPDNYMPIDLKKNDKMNDLNIGQEINVIKLKNKIYIII